MKHRKVLLWLPVIVWPFAILIFWLLGGGNVAGAGSASHANGLNMQLPDPKLKSLSALDKLNFYTVAHQDSLKKVELAKMDPNLEEEVEVVKPIEERVNRVRDYRSARVYEERLVPKSEEMNELQQMVMTLQQPKADPELEALNGTLKQLVALQQPKRTDVAALEKKVFRVSTANGAVSAGFFGESGIVIDSAATGEISAVVHGEQVLQNGSVIKLRLLSPVTVDGQEIPPGVFVFGIAGILNERLIVEISSIPFNGRIFPVNVKVFDLDGIEGIYIPGSTTREVVKQVAEQGVQSVGLMSVDQSLRAQAAAAGISAVKSLVGRKAARVRVTIKSEYRVFLRDEKRRD